MDIKKISELEETQNLYNGCCIPLVQDEETKKVRFQTISEKIKNELTDELRAVEAHVDEKAKLIESYITKQPIIQNGTWWVWNDFDRRYVDTGQISHGETGQAGEDGFSPTVETSKSGKTTTVTITDASGTHTFEINDGDDGQGSGDMLRSIYDTNNNGTVDDSEKLGGRLPSYYAAASDVPTKTSDLQNDSGFLTEHQDISGKADKPTVLTGTLTAGQTSITLTDVAITTTSIIDIYTDIYGISPTSASTVNGSTTLTFDAQTNDVSVRIEVR